MRWVKKVLNKEINVLLLIKYPPKVIPNFTVLSEIKLPLSNYLKPFLNQPAVNRFNFFIDFFPGIGGCD